MQKKLIALALASLAGSAFAQTNVTIYGIADGTFDSVRVSGDVKPTSNRISANSSYIGFKGSEDLGNGLKAVFQYEMGVNFDQGNATALSTSRDSFIGISSGWGSVVLGNLTGPTRALGTALDVNAGATGIGSNSGILGKFSGVLQGFSLNAAGDFANTPCAGGSGACASLFDTRWKNSIAYVSPNFSGFNVTALYIPNENNRYDAAGNTNTNGYDLGLKYENGPIMVALTYSDLRVNNAALATVATVPSNQIAPAPATGALQFTEIKARDLRLGGSYNFGVGTIRAIYERTKFRGENGQITVAAPGVNVPFGGIDEDQNVYGVGGTWNITPAGKILVQYYRAQDIGDTDDTGATLWEIGYEHSLSKRTMLKAMYANLKSDDNTLGAYDFGNSATGVARAGETARGLQIGIRHAF